MIIKKISSSRLCQSLYEVKQNPQPELCASLEIRLLIAYYCTRWRCYFKWLQQDAVAGKICRKPLGLSLLHMNIYRMATAWSISLNSTVHLTSVTRSSQINREIQQFKVKPVLAFLQSVISETCKLGTNGRQVLFIRKTRVKVVVSVT